jgi:hypothetical protein
MRSENYGVIYVLKPGDHQAGVAGDSFHMGRVHVAAWVIQFATLTGDGVLTIKSGASAGTETTAETFRYRLADAAQGSATADTFGDWTTSSSLTLTAATYQNKTLICELDNDQLTAAQPWVTLAFSAAASALNASVVAVVTPRYQAHDALTYIT